MVSRGFQVLAVVLVSMGVVAFLGGLLAAPAPAAIAGIPTEPPPTRTPRPSAAPPPTATPRPSSPPPPTATRRPSEMPPPTPTSPRGPTRTARPTAPGAPTAPPGPTAPPAEPTEPAPPDYFIVDVAAPVPPEPAPAPWVGVVDFLRRNICVTHGGVTACQGDWIVNANPSLYENRNRRTEQLPINPASQGDMRPAEPADDVHVPRPQCLVNGQWIYVPGTWYYNGLSDVVVEAGWHDERFIHYGPPQYSVEFDVLVRYHRAHVPEPGYPGRTAWNFGALGECRDIGGGGGGEPPPPPPPPPPPEPPPAGCPACYVNVVPAGTREDPSEAPWQTITLTWDCQAEGGEPIGYVVRAYVPQGEEWVLRERRDLPESARRAVLPVVPGFLYRAEVAALFDVGGSEQECCFGETYYRYYQELPTRTASLEARVEYWSEHDPDYPAHGPDNPYRTAGPFLNWNYGETLHAHPTAELVEPVPPAGWSAGTTLLRWRYRGSATNEWHPARCDPPGAASCGWFEELPRAYVHLRWFRHLLPGETEGVAAGDTRAWAYATDPLTVSLAYQVQAETTWTNTQTGFQLTWPAFTATLTVTVDLQYPTTYRGAR